jgi:hypothetical protein
MQDEWRNEGEFIVVKSADGERRLNRVQAVAYRNTLQWPEEYNRFEPFENRQLLVVDPDFAKAATIGLIQMGHPRHETRQ